MKIIMRCCARKDRNVYSRARLAVVFHPKYKHGDGARVALSVIYILYTELPFSCELYLQDKSRKIQIN